MTASKSKPRMAAQRKLDLYLATREPDAPLGETRSVRPYGVHLDGLREIEETIEGAALAALKAKGRHGRRRRRLRGGSRSA